MAKTIVFCADGTWNGPEDASGESVLDSPHVANELTETAVTNVVKLYANIAGMAIADSVALADENEKWVKVANVAMTQVAKYLHQLVNRASYVPNTTGTTSQAIHTPWTKPPFDHLGCTRRIVDATKEQIHPSVKQRWQADSSYRPAPLIGIW